MMYFSQAQDYAAQLLIQINLWLSTQGCLLLAAFLITLLFILKIFSPQQKEKTYQPAMHSIAGEDVWTAQLDLARAFLEMGKKQEAQNILKQVAQQGNSAQRQEAIKLLAKRE